MNLADVGKPLAYSAILELETTVLPGGVGGPVFDHYGPNEFKFVRIDAVRDVIEVGHVAAKGGLKIDQTFAKTLVEPRPCVALWHAA